MSDLPIPLDRRREFIRHYALTGNCEYAVEKAGFADQSYGRLLLRQSQIREAIRLEIERQLTVTALPLALNTVINVMRSPNASHRDKLTAAKIIVDRTGLDAVAGAEGKAPHEMTRDEIIAKIAQLEAERAERAIPINPAPEQPEEGDIFA